MTARLLIVAIVSTAGLIALRSTGTTASETAALHAGVRRARSAAIPLGGSRQARPIAFAKAPVVDLDERDLGDGVTIAADFTRSVRFEDGQVAAVIDSLRVALDEDPELAAVLGRVTYAGDDEPVAYGTVVLTDTLGRDLHVVTDARGWYHAGRIDPGRYVITAHDGGVRSVLHVEIARGELETFELQLLRQEPATAPEILCPDRPGGVDREVYGVVFAGATGDEAAYVVEGLDEADTDAMASPP